MSTFKEIIDRVDEARPNAFHNKVKLKWLTDLNGKVAADVFLMDIAEVRALPNGFPGALNAEPLVNYPFEDIYDLWLEARIYAANEEYDKYQNMIELFNESYSSFTTWFLSAYRPGDGAQGLIPREDFPSYFITAYGMAVRYGGFNGTVEEWLESLRGPQGDTGKSAYQYAREAGYSGTEEQFRESQLNNGKTAYEYACEGGYTGTAAEFRVKMAKEYASANHHHDNSYAPKDHNHDTNYSPKNHNHDENYAPKNHDHDASYASKVHNHDDDYLKKSGGSVTGDLTMDGGALVLKEGVNFGTEAQRPDAAELPDGTVYLRILE